MLEEKILEILSLVILNDVNLPASNKVADNKHVKINKTHYNKHTNQNIIY
tara:strand:+ start:277 stop:426 length:150 start_codon:yes stop_codon:yes gene_type:complete